MILEPGWSTVFVHEIHEIDHFDYFILHARKTPDPGAIPEKVAIFTFLHQCMHVKNFLLSRTVLLNTLDIFLSSIQDNAWSIHIFFSWMFLSCLTSSGLIPRNRLKSWRHSSLRAWDSLVSQFSKKTGWTSGMAGRTACNLWHFWPVNAQFLGYMRNIQVLMHILRW